MMRKIFFLFLITLAFAGLSARPWERFFNGSRIEIEIPPLESLTLDNGVVVYYKQNNTLPRINFQLVVDGGESEERQDSAGLTSLWGNSVVFSGSKKYPRDVLSGILEARASDFGFSSSLERSIFSLTSLTEYFRSDIEMISEVIQNPVFADEDIALLKSQMIQGIKKRTENPASMAHLASNLIFWKDNIRGKLSTERSVSAISEKDLSEWNRVMISPERMSVLVTGDFSVEEMRQILNATIGKFESGGKDFDFKILELPDLSDRRGGGNVHYLIKEIPQTTVLFLSPGLHHSHPDYYALKLYDHLLGGNSFNSYLTQVIRVKNGWAYSVYSTYYTSAYAGVNMIFTQTQNKNVNDVIAEIEKTLRSPESFLSADKMAEAKHSIANSFVFFGETPEKMAALQLSLRWDNLNDDYLRTFLEKINQVTLEDLHRVARKYYAPENFMISVVGPDSVITGLKDRYPDRNITPASLPQ